jgi:hypothetical protein
MKKLAAFFLLLLAACSSLDVGRLMEDYLWEKRVLLIFMPSADHPNYQAMLKRLPGTPQSLKDRDVVIWRIIEDAQVSIDDELKPQLPTKPFYRYFKVKEGEFAVILLGKDGEEKFRGKKDIGTGCVETIIDLMPMGAAEKAARNR